ncbi:Solute carrier 2 (Facilitated glucose transporter) member 8 [Halocaridina rubra]|uniref:Solute carrier 2 (Facilitated glucose transporter) member 8 n=1 Tax=Halocaridina rubra TaxID=373956 RepID=A0AAN8ZXA6_HALRR
MASEKVRDSVEAATMDIGTSSSQLVLERQKASHLTQYIAALSATIGAFSFGCALGYSSPAGPMLMANATEDGDISLSEDENSWFVSTINIGALVGGPLGGILISVLGRRATMMFSVVFFVGAWLLTIFAQNFAMLISSRIIVGLSTGITCISVPTYIGELASIDIRGTLGSAFQLMVVIGIEYAYVFGAFIETWQILAVVCAVPTVIYLVCMIFAKESPVFLLSKGKQKEAKESLQYFRGKNYDIQKELDEIQLGLDEAKKNKTSPKSLFTSYLFKPLSISLALMFFQQFSGVNAVLLNLTSIFQDAGASLSDDVSVILVGLVQVLATVVAGALIDRAGRKILLIISSSLMAVSLGKDTHTN